MSLVGKVGRRKPRAICATIVVYVLLILGAVTTVYPFLLMVSTGFKGPTDENDNALVPKFWFDGDELLTKYVHDKYRMDESAIASTRTGPAPPTLVEKWRKFLETLPDDLWTVGFRQAPNQVTSRAESLYRDWLRRRFKGDIVALNRAYLEEQTSFDAVSAPAELYEQPKWSPRPGPRWDDWQRFKQTLPAEFRLPILRRRLFQIFVKGKYRNVLSEVPASLRGSAKSFEEIDLPPGGPLVAEFLTKLPARLRQDSVERRWRAVAGSAAPPIEAFERSALARKQGEIKSEMSGRNFRYVLDYIVFHGRALWNTLIFALLTILIQLTVNPLAAYALSRYPIKASGKILLFLLATMAFPAEVAMIPQFLLLKGMGMLNTFAALVLPAAASGYMIFLLKGFFDSLPQELFEAGQIDGARESTLMMKIALPLSKPVLGYMALLAFMAAYGSFLYAFLVVQDQRMWTLMVFIYQLQTSGAPRAVIMAALTVAALPTLIIFLLCQRVIMQGIVLPGER